jgi:tetratricopeptide (TPR) repeat protein
MNEKEINPMHKNMRSLWFDWAHHERFLIIFFICSLLFLPIKALDIMNISPEINALYAAYNQNTDTISARFALGNALLNAGNTYYQNNMITDALTIYQYLAELFPQSAAIYHNIGFALAELNRPHEAIDAYNRALTYAPDDQNIHICLATAYLAAGDLERGFAHYEWRWQGENNALAKLPIAIWQGENLQNKTILLRSEGALGDVIQFIRYAQHLKELGATVIVQAMLELHPLLSGCAYIDELISSYTLPDFADYQAPLMSLAHLCATDQIMIPNKPYIHADQKLSNQWQSCFDPHTFNIGICWQADPQNDKNRPLLAQRSVPLGLFEPIANIPGVMLYSLQAIDGTDELATTTWGIKNFGADFDQAHGRFMDTAAIMSNLDLIICVDTSIAHLAGGLGRPTWVILPFKADWRWMTERTDSPWYPNMRLFRKSYDQEWEPVLQEITRTLRYYIKTDLITRKYHEL